MLRIICFVLFLTGCSQGFKAYCPNTYNASWSSLPAKIKPVNLTVEQLDALNKAIDDWNKAAGIEYLRIDYNSYQTIRNNGYNFDSTQQAVTSSYWKNSIIFKSDIYINTDGLNAIDLESLYVHELGHFLGLEHIPNTVMNDSLPSLTKRTQIQPIVLESLRCLYEQK